MELFSALQFTLVSTSSNASSWKGNTVVGWRGKFAPHLVTPTNNKLHTKRARCQAAKKSTCCSCCNFTGFSIAQEASKFSLWKFDAKVALLISILAEWAASNFKKSICFKFEAKMCLFSSSLVWTKLFLYTNNFGHFFRSSCVRPFLRGYPSKSHNCGVAKTLIQQIQDWNGFQSLAANISVKCVPIVALCL
jgi:hypothetical protein